MSGDLPAVARELWVLLEPVHDVTYFTPQARAAHEVAGLRGFWRGYVATRAAPLGPVGVAPVTAVFHNFAPAFLARSLPQVWEMASPERALAARAAGAEAALDAHLPDVLAEPRLAEATAVLRRAVEAVEWAGRPLGAANAVLPWPEEPLRALWHAATVLREHRGDGHVALLVAEGLDGVEAHVLRDAEDASSTVTKPNRGWTDEEWAAAAERLVGRGLLDRAGGLTERGRALRVSLERRTDELAAAPYAAATPGELAMVAEFLRPIARRLIPGAIPYPNPVGAPLP
ncbi:hypothetical protein SAMN05421810_10674 [Amycolatopsis arida]|uniref:SalK n=1 Tax=Amycolatopsis arida TaxID=587909 RepID=A0A1I5XHR3_9PSEU|nr:hypothetical protein [Amycolatopsis arida]TDX97443.1 hypothetical protein CLV69_102547 [Amycolatopsis arida]SFQ31484.1 hypothetical protein SAMN05421810_10674 [Amycolatopsis arida]